jgi:hypothetical protein
MPNFIPASDTLEFLEYVGTTGQSVVLNVTGDPFPANTQTITINSVTASESIPDLVITISNNSFTFSSKFPDFFDRTIKYLVEDDDFNKTYYSVNGFNQVDRNYTGIYQYVPPSVQFRDVIFTVTYTGSITGQQTSSWSTTIRYNSEYSNQKFKELVLAGKTYQQATLIYPELNL